MTIRPSKRAVMAALASLFALPEWSYEELPPHERHCGWLGLVVVADANTYVYGDSLYAVRRKVLQWVGAFR